MKDKNEAILPQLSNRFRVVPQIQADEQRVNFTKSVISANLDQKNKKITLLLRENIVATVFESINTILKTNICPLVIDSIEYDRFRYSLDFIDATVVSHNVTFTYERDNILTHELVFSYKNFRIDYKNNHVQHDELPNRPIYKSPKDALDEYLKTKEVK